MLFFEEPTRTRKKCPEKMKRELYKAQGGKCMYCGRKLGIDLMDCDHKNPMAKGGSDLKRNYQVLCRTCNTRKGATTDRQFRTKFKSIGVLQTQRKFRYSGLEWTMPESIQPRDESRFGRLTAWTGTFVPQGLGC